jgi:hypothetical protein
MPKMPKTGENKHKVGENKIALLQRQRHQKQMFENRECAVPAHGHGGHSVSQIFHAHRDGVRHLCHPQPQGF